MLVNADFAERVVIAPQDHVWAASPMPGVERVMLDRIGAEVARATSIVRYAPNARFSEHVHGGGEEILVLEGAFHDADGAYPAGTYVRNPIGSAHAPWAGPQGAILFVKLGQFAPDDTARVVVDTLTAAFAPGLVPGLSVLPLHHHGPEGAALVRWAPHTRFQPHRHWGGEEILVLDGVLEDEHGRYPQGAWLRSPHLSGHTPFTGASGALIYVKTGHLAATVA
jgi:anti-sigma factor ChrR (cupin superfamily)